MAMPADVPGFDTLSYARRLKDAGVDEAQAEAHAEAIRDAMTRDVATKADITRLENKMDKGLAALETRMTVRFVGVAIGIIIANIGVIAAAVMALAALLP